MRKNKLARIEKARLILDEFQLIEESGFSIWLKPHEKNSVAFFNSCAHKGGDLEWKQQFVCKQHGWTYTNDGLNLTSGAPGLRKVSIANETSEFIELNLPIKHESSSSRPRHDLVFRVLSHASIMLEYRGFKLLIDPWLFGTAYYGAWKLNPQAKLTHLDFIVDAILITHPHPDHFHLESLSHIESEVPLYFPTFQSGIIERGLESIDWKNRIESLWDEPISLSKHVTFRFIQPKSLWEDSAVLVTVEDEDFQFNWLNLVDAGAALNEQELPPIDFMTSAFSPGASGYPLTWSHLEENQKVLIMNQQKDSLLRLLPRRCADLNVKYFLPFAGHWRLNLPEHEKYESLIPRTSLDEVEDEFERVKSSTKVLKLFPGTEFNFRNGLSSSFAPYKSHDSAETLLEHRLELSQSEYEYSKLVLQFESFMNQLEAESEFYGVERVEFTILIQDKEYRKTFFFESSTSRNDEVIQISVCIPERIFCLLAQGLANWDHIAIGYWGIWHRTPNRYPSNFMRMLQIGKSKIVYSSRLKYLHPSDSLLRKTIGDLMELNPQAVSAILNRAGLPCGSCLKTNSETLEDALLLHNIDIRSTSWILRELSFI
jgi:CMP-N-acetylneuraminate monooxygenase